jgi:hypothetical protein
MGTKSTISAHKERETVTNEFRGEVLNPAHQSAWVSGSANSATQGSGTQINFYMTAPRGVDDSQEEIVKQVETEPKNIYREEHDPTLAIIIGALENYPDPVDEGIWVVLNVRGSVISGELIPRWQWFDEQAKGPGGGSILQYFAEIAKEAHEENIDLQNKEAEKLSEEERSILRNLPTHIHLRNARNFLPLPVPANGYHWRGRMDEISGWAFGRLSQGEE